MRRPSLTALACSLLAILSPLALARGRPTASMVLVPQVRALLTRGRNPVEVTGVSVEVTLIEQAATTTMDVSLRNTTNARQQAELVMPVPDGAVVRGMDFQGGGVKPSAKVLPRDEARRTYEGIVAKMRDPALLEFVGYNLIRTSVFPVEARGRQKVRIVYETLVAADGGRRDYVLPRSVSVEYDVPWRISVTLRSKVPISTVYSPTHPLSVRRGKGAVTVRAGAGVTRDPGPFRLSFLTESQSLTSSLFAYPSSKADGGYFLLLAGLPAKAPTRTIPREVTLVLDRSGSMDGKKMRQVREAAEQVLRSLGAEESFNILTYNQDVSQFADRPIPKTPRNEFAAILHLNTVRSRGGTNVYDALQAALRQRPVEGSLPIVLFLTDGLPTVGNTSEKTIRDLARHSNPHGRRVFTFGVGVGVNTPLLERIASDTRGTSTFVLPEEDVKVKVNEVFSRLAGPVLADAELTVDGANGELASRRVHDVIPSQLPDLFAGDQLVVLGRYAGREPITVAVRGNYLGEHKTFRFGFDPASASVHNAFVPRLWASRRIGVLLDRVRDLGADLGLQRGSKEVDGQMGGLVAEVVRLSTEHGILTEYTAFLALEGTDLTRRDVLLVEARRNLTSRAMRRRSGLDSLTQELNGQALRRQRELNIPNHYLNGKMEPVTVAKVQQVADRAFYRRRGGWVDSRILESDAYTSPGVTIRFGTRQYMDLAYKLAKEGRQGCLAFRGDIVMLVGGEPVLIEGPGRS